MYHQFRNNVRSGNIHDFLNRYWCFSWKFNLHHLIKILWSIKFTDWKFLFFSGFQVKIGSFSQVLRNILLWYKYWERNILIYTYFSCFPVKLGSVMYKGKPISTEPDEKYIQHEKYTIKLQYIQGETPSKLIHQQNNIDLIGILWCLCLSARSLVQLKQKSPV